MRGSHVRGGEAFDLYRMNDRRRFHELAVQTEAALLVLDADCTVRYLSPAARGVFAQLAAPLLDRHLFSVVYHDDLHLLRRRLDRSQHHASCAGAPRAQLARLYTRRDRWQWFVLTSFPMTYDDDQRVVAVTLRTLNR